MGALQSITLNHFRCYDTQSLKDLPSGLIVLCGANGAGKTNILEAISLLTPGRGIRGAKPGEIQKHNAEKPWAISAKIQTKYEEITLGTGRDPQTDKRIIRINGQSARSQTALSQYLACVWLTPQMDRLFIDSSRERRKFLDRLIFAFDAGHAGRINRYDNALAQRSKLLRDGRHDDSWLAGLENQMAETGMAIAAARLDFTQKLQTACQNADHAHFPLARLQLCGTLEERLTHSPALELEEDFKQQLGQSRSRDAQTGGAQTGPHKSDLNVIYAAKNMPAGQCSTGEQKALLIGLILAHAALIKAEKGRPPLLLLDEVAAHLDEIRRAALYEILIDLNAQVWLTGTEENLFDAIKPTARFFEIKEARAIEKESQPRPRSA